MTKPQSPTPPDRLARAALLFGSGTLSSRILGLIRDALIFSLMPLDLKDAWFAAFRIPNFFRRLLGEGGLSVSFIPIYVATLESPEADQKVKPLVNGVYSLLMGISLLICVFSYLFMDKLVGLMLSGDGFSTVPGKLETTVAMSEVMIFFLFTISLFAFLMALLNGQKKFTLTGYAPVMMNLAIIFALWWYQDHPQFAMASAWAVVIGGGLQALILVPAVFKLGIHPRWTWDVWNPQVRRVVAKFIPTVFGVGVLQFLAMLNLYFASQLPSGSITYIYMADRLLELPLSLVAVSIGTTLLPTLSSYWSRGDRTLFTETMSRQLGLFLLLALPATFGLWMVGEDIVAVLFQRGEFRAEEVPTVSWLLKIYGLTLITAGGQRVLSSAFYASGDTQTPAVVSLVGLLIHCVLAPYWMQKWGIYGLVGSTSFITFFNLALCLVLIQYKAGSLLWKMLGVQSMKCLSASLVMAIPLYFFNQWSWRTNHFYYDFPLLLAVIGFAGCCYFAVAWLLGVGDVKVLGRKILRRRA